MNDLHNGQCLCGDIQYSVRGLPLPRSAVVCHCNFCQRQTGGAFAIEVFFAEENVEFTGTKPAIYEHHSDESGRWLRLEFCPRCGTRVGMTAERRPGEHAIPGGTFDDPDWFAIDRHIFTKSKLCWTEIPADVERS